MLIYLDPLRYHIALSHALHRHLRAHLLYHLRNFEHTDHTPLAILLLKLVNPHTLYLGCHRFVRAIDASRVLHVYIFRHNLNILIQLDVTYRSCHMHQPFRKQLLSDNIPKCFEKYTFLRVRNRFRNLVSPPQLC